MAVIAKLNLQTDLQVYPALPEVLLHVTDKAAENDKELGKEFASDLPNWRVKLE